MPATDTNPPRLLTTMDGHTLVAYTHKADARPGSLPHGVGLFAAPAGESHEFVVWTVIDRRTETAATFPPPPHVQWMVEQGDYAWTLGTAVAAYVRRGGHVLPEGPE